MTVTRTQLRVTTIHKSDDTLQEAALTAELTAPTCLLQCQMDDDQDNYSYHDLGGQRSNYTPIDNDSGDLRSQLVDNDCQDMVTQNRLLLEMPLENQAKWKAELRLEKEQMAAEWESMLADQDQWAAKRVEPSERSTVGPRPNIYTTVYPRSIWGGVKEQDQFLDSVRSNFDSGSHIFPRGWPNMSNTWSLFWTAGVLIRSNSWRDGDYRSFEISGRLICGVWTMHSGHRPLFSRDGQVLWS